MRNSGGPLVSVVVPTRNRAHCLPRALDSILAQEGLGDQFDIETIVVDDASSDGTADVVAGYPEARYVRFPSRRGVSAALNEGIRISTGSYVSVLGDDDAWLPEKLSVQVPPLAANPDVGVVYGQTLVRTRDEEFLFPEVGRAKSGWIFLDVLMDKFCSHHAAALIRREALEKVGDFDESLASYEDFDLSLRLARHFPFLFVPGPVTIYNVSPEGAYLTRVSNGLAAADVSRVVEKALQLLPDSDNYTPVRREARARATFELSSALLLTGDLVLARARLIEALSHHPWSLNQAWGRAYVRDLARERLSRGEPPTTVVGDLFLRVKRATRPHRVAERWGLGRLLAELGLDAARAVRRERA